MNISIRVDGIDTIKQDLNAEILNIQMAIAYALPQVYDETKNRLQDHIKTDVYDKYKPKVYPRRSEYPQFGPPLSDMDANLREYVQTIPQGNMWGSFGLEYLPTGEHSGTTGDYELLNQKYGYKYYNPDNPQPLKAYPPKGDRTDGDDLIRRIETGQGYGWSAHPGKRPFWQKFVNEMVDGERFATYFRTAMANQGVVIEDAHVMREDSDGQY